MESHPIFRDTADPSRSLLEADHLCARSYTESQQRTCQENSDPRMPAPKQSRSEVDGCRAWFTLACIFIVNANTLGSLKVYGLIFEEIVSQKYYTREEASWPISTASTIQNLAGESGSHIFQNSLLAT